MKHHEVIIDFNRRGMVTLVKRGFTHVAASMRSHARREEQPQLQADQGSSVAG